MSESEPKKTLTLKKPLLDESSPQRDSEKRSASGSRAHRQARMNIEHQKTQRGQGSEESLERPRFARNERREGSSDRPRFQRDERREGSSDRPRFPRSDRPEGGSDRPRFPRSDRPEGNPDRPRFQRDERREGGSDRPRFPRDERREGGSDRPRFPRSDRPEGSSDRPRFQRDERREGSSDRPRFPRSDRPEGSSDRPRFPRDERREGSSDRPRFQRDERREGSSDRPRFPRSDRPEGGSDRPRFPRDERREGGSDRPRFPRSDRPEGSSDRPRFQRDERREGGSDRPRFQRDERREGSSDRPRFPRDERREGSSDRPRFQRDERREGSSDRPRFQRDERREGSSDRPRFPRDERREGGSDRPRFPRSDRPEGSSDRPRFPRDERREGDSDRPRFPRSDRPEGSSDRPRFQRDERREGSSDRPRFPRSDRPEGGSDRPRFPREAGQRTPSESQFKKPTQQSPQSTIDVYNPYQGRHKAFASCPRGMEEILATELQAIGLDRVQSARAGVHFESDWAGIQKANLYSRLATRVLVRVADGPVSSEDDIARLARKTPWESWFGPDHTLRVDTSAINSPMKSLQFCNLLVKDGICDRLRDLEGARPSIDTVRPDARVHLFLSESAATLYLDTSGESLFKRGWRLDKGEAPIRENLAAGLLALSQWNPETPLLDPFCGSATILIEAAWIALDIAPGINRPFAFERLRHHNVAAWQALRQEATARIKTVAPAPIIGLEINEFTLEAAKRNLSRTHIPAGVITLMKGDACSQPCPAPTGLILTNPPYGVRIEVEQELMNRWASHLKQNFSGWHVGVISADMELPRQMRLKAKRRTPIFNGALDCRLFMFDLVTGSYQS